MRISDLYGLHREQATLDFVDVDVLTDIPAFVDPRAIGLLRSQWGRDAQHALRTYFHLVLERLRSGGVPAARPLLGPLREPNETHLGYSRGRSRGHGLGKETGKDVATALASSRAVETGLLRDLEETVLMIPGIDRDVLSDMTTGVIRGALIGYTQRMASELGIPMENQASGPVWHPSKREWQDGLTLLPRAAGRALLLVPKAIVRVKLNMEKSEYYSGYLLPLLEQDEWASGSSDLIQVLKQGPRILKKDLREKYPEDKLAIVRYTESHPEALDSYRADRDAEPRLALDHAGLAEVTGTSVPDFAALLAVVSAVSPGLAGATPYHRAVEELLTALLYPALTEPKIETPANEGRKRIDIRYTNIAQTGFFKWVHDNYSPQPYVFVECKNYTGDVGNEEVDQLAGRFGNDRGRLGILCYRSVANKDLLLKRCRDVAQAGNGYILALDDQDLAEIVQVAQGTYGIADTKVMGYRVLAQRFSELVN